MEATGNSVEILNSYLENKSICARYVASLSSLTWYSRFIDETPGDSVVGGPPRQVKGACWSRVMPTPSPNPTLQLWSEEMANSLSISKGDLELLSGGKPCDGMDPYAQRYGGHQFGHWAHQLGDGRAITLGEVESDTEIVELQLKGAGLTPYSRTADGKAVLRSSIREFLCSEAMHHLGIPTTRALSLSTTGEEVMRDILYDGNRAFEQGAIVCRVSPSFIRFGSFQIHAATGDTATLRKLVEHTIINHFPNHQYSNDQQLLSWLAEIAKSTATMVSHWMRVGFVHGVMNTDNMSIHGLTIDYGPYGWIEDYNPNWTPNTTDLAHRRYRFANQPQIAGWNLARFLEAIAPLFDEPEQLSQILDIFFDTLSQQQNSMWAGKLGLDSFSDEDVELVRELNTLLQLVETDMTIFFRTLSEIEKPEINDLKFAFYDEETIPQQQWNEWLHKWWNRVEEKPNREKMKLANPKYVLRNWMAQLAIDDAEKGDFSLSIELFNLLKNPYSEQIEFQTKWFAKRPEWARNKVGCSMLSCSS